MNIKDKFVELTSRTYPHGTEKELYQFLPDCLETDAFGNRFVQIGETSTMFTCHLDTATQANVTVNHVFDGDIIKTDGKSILGADDKAGVTIMLYMIENKVPGLYYFFLGEEVGCVGSKKLADAYKHKSKPEYIKKVIAFDRRALDSVITFQGGNRCCSEDFGNALAAALNEASKNVTDNDAVFNYKIDPSGVYTDSAQFMPIYPECTNISVGYYSEHHYTESQNIKHLDKLAKTCCFVKWEELPIKRDPSVVEKRYSSNAGYHGYNRSDDNEQYSEMYGYGGRAHTSRHNVTKDEKTQFIDYEYGKYVSTIVTEKNKDKGTEKIKSVDFAIGRLNYEKGLIADFFSHLRVHYRDITWGGDKLTVWHETTTDSTEISRAELAEYIEELDFWKDVVEKQKNTDMFDSQTWMF